MRGQLIRVFSAIVFKSTLIIESFDQTKWVNRNQHVPNVRLNKRILSRVSLLLVMPVNEFVIYGSVPYVNHIMFVSFLKII
jgi:hypothetical protein